MKKNKPNKWVRRHIHYYLVYGVITLSISTLAKSTETDIPLGDSTKVAEFDSGFFIGNSESNIDLSRFKYNNPILPGEYSVDIYLNQVWQRRQTLVFKSSDQKSNAHTCFTASKLLELGVKSDVLKQKVSDINSEQCLKIEEWISNAYSIFDSSNLRIDISIPQIALNQNSRDYIDPSQWDRGVNAGFLSYNISAYKSFGNSNINDTNVFGSITTGANIAGWQLRHNGTWQWNDLSNSTTYNAISTYLQRAFPQYNGVLTLGDSFTSGEIFDSFSYRGIDFSSDDRMLPNSMLGYAPRIRGFAKTNAKVEIRQRGQIIYQTTVAAGDFEINDLYPTGFGGDLEVAILENDGTIQTFSVPYSSIVQMLRPGMKRYSFTLGQFRDKGIDSNPLVFQAKYQQGINNFLTGYTGIQLSENYQAASIGIAFATPIGAIAFDSIHSQAKIDKAKNTTGQSYRLSYSKNIQPTDTYFSLAAYRYSTENYSTLRDAIYNNYITDKGLTNSSVGKQRSEFQVSISQGLPINWGNFFLTGSWKNFWNRQETERQYQIGYSNSYKNLNFSLSATKRQIENKISNDISDDTEYSLALSFPLTFRKQTVNVSTITTRKDTNIGISGNINDRFSYGTSISSEFGGNSNLNVNAQYITNYAKLDGSYSISDSFKQASLSASGNIVAHSGGISFGAEQGQTMVIVHAPNAVGAKVSNGVGLEINKSGYAVIPYITPYRLNDITLDPQNMSNDVELMETSQRIAPYAGAITRVSFATKLGKALYIQATRTNGEVLPFGAEVYNSDNENIGMVAQGGLVYLRSNKLVDTVTVKWGENANHQCKINYNVSALAESTTDQNIITTEAVCQ